jgi:glycosyltransferase involved in cell wall biosynthesis
VTSVHVLLPEGVDDPGWPSGGNRYDRRLCDGLVALGWDVRERAIPGEWPRADAAGLAALAGALDAVPTCGLVLLDGLIASAAAAVLQPAAARLRLVALVHMPRPDGVPTAAEEVAGLAAMRAVITTSAWTRRILTAEGVPAGRIHVALPGVDAAEPAAGTPAGGRLLAVGAVVPHKGQDLLLAALSRIAGLDWTCTLVGPTDRAPAFAESVRERASALGSRVRLTGPLAGAPLAAAYRSADLLVLPSRAESFGLVVLEALATGLPVVGFRVGGVPEALGLGGQGRPGVLVPPEDPAAFAGALEAWLTDGALRARLRAAAAAARRALPGWDATARTVAGVLSAVPD